MPLVQKPIDQVRAKKTGAARHENTLLRKIITSHAKIPVRQDQNINANVLASKAEQNG